MVGYHAKSIEDTLKNLDTSKNGLSQAQADQRLQRYGLNELKAEKRISPVKIFFSQFKSFIVLILIVAMVISIILPHPEYVQATTIGIILILNAIIGFKQEYNAEKAIEALKKMASLQAVVLRDGKEQKVDAKDLVPGDIIILETGEKIPADARLIESVNLQTMESALTGESVPTKKDVKTLSQNIPVADMHNMVFSGTIITAGRGKAVVSGTGMDTEFGRIARMIQEDVVKLTPLQKKLKRLGEYLGVAAIMISVVVFLTGVLVGLDPVDMLLTGITLAVAAIPEGLPAVVAVTLSIGVVRMVKKNALIRKLPSVETLGSTTVICTDKTGTLTLNEMTVRKLFMNDKVVDVTGRGYEAIGDFLVDKKKVSPKPFDLMLRIGALCNDAKVSDKKVIGDPTEGCLIVSAEKAGVRKDELEKTHPRLGELEFNSERKRMSTLHMIGGKKTVYTKGAPDIILDLCSKIYKDGKVKPINSQDKKKILEMNESFARQALRVLGFAYKQSDRIVEKDMVFVGLQGMIDPPRHEAKEAIAKAKRAGIKVVMITGDFKLTAAAIGKELGLGDKALDAKEIDRIHNLEDHVEDVNIYARVDPRHKVKILEALKKRGHIVAMTGDGVNDAPALKKADIGIAMGITGTDVAKEAADMILTDDNFASIVNAIEEGRGIYDNIRKFVNYLLSSNAGEVLTIFIATLFLPFFGNTIPLLPLQILWINLVTDGLPALALGIEPSDSDIMDRPPRNPKENIITKGRAVKMVVVGLMMMAGTLSLFKYYNPHDNPAYARTVAFTVLMMFQMWNVLNSRSETHSLFEIGLSSNLKLFLAVVISIVLQFAVIYIPFMHDIFKTGYLSLVDWVLIICVSGSVFVLAEAIKFFERRNHVSGS